MPQERKPNWFVLAEQGWLSYFDAKGQPVFQPTQQTIFYVRNEITAKLAQERLEELGFTFITLHNEHYQDERSIAKMAWESQSKIRDNGAN